MSLRCPNCTNEMMLSNKNGVEIDHCPKCRGVWLDRWNWKKLQVCKIDMMMITIKNTIPVEIMIMMMMITTVRENTKKRLFRRFI